MNSEETKIYELEKKLGFSYKTDLPILFIVLICIFSISDIVNLYTPWGNSLKEIIEQAYSTKYFSKFIYFIPLLIIVSLIWPFFRRYRICLKIVNLREKQLSTCRSENISLGLLLRGQPPTVVNNTTINFYPEADTPVGFETDTSFKPTPDKHGGPETKNETGHTTIPTSVAKPINSGKSEIFATANPHNEDQE